jgi:conjugal transfer pilus assembly protein TraV
MKTSYSWLIAAAFTLCGCSAVLNPYQSNFSCPETEKGKCVSVQKAYSDSLNPLVRPESEGKEGACRDCGKDKPADPATTREESEYRGALFKRLAGLLNEPETPMVAPPQVMRVLLLPYRGDGGELFMPRYAYFFLDRPKWILDGYLVEKGDE